MVLDHGRPWLDMVLIRPWSTMGGHLTKHGRPWSTMVDHGCMTMDFHGRLWYTMVFHGHLTIIFTWGRFKMSEKNDDDAE